nr:response regulator transcription factor [Prochlorococcus marinus]
MLDVLIVEDDLILLDFLTQEVSNQINVSEREVRKASSLKRARYLISQKTPDWLLLDLCLPDGSGVELAQEFARDNLNAKIIILTAQADQFAVPADLLKNVYALLNKADGLAPLREAVWEICREFDSTLPDLSNLTPRQLEFLHLIGEGLDTAQISKRLDVSFATAQTHRRQITRKLGIKGSALVTLARNLPKVS